MPHLSPDYVYRFLRVSAVCREQFDKRLEPITSILRCEERAGFAWRHADLFLAGFPRVGLKHGHDMLCHFSLNDSNRSSRLLGYVKDGPKMVPDRIESDIRLFGGDDDAESFIGSVKQDQQVLSVPEIPLGWNAEGYDCPAWLKPNPNVILTDDGTCEGVFERAQLLLWSNEPVNRWHAVGYAHHEIRLSPPALGDSWHAVDAEWRPVDRTEAVKSRHLPDQWLPLVEIGIDCTASDWATLPPEEGPAFAGKTCNVVRFYTFSGHLPEAFYEVTVWITDDVWHARVLPILMGKGGFVC